MNNPFVGMAVGAWTVFLMTCAACQFQFAKWAWMLWTLWLTIATLAPLIWWWTHRKTTQEKTTNDA